MKEALKNEHLRYLLDRGINEGLINSHSIDYYNIKNGKLQLDLEISGIHFPYFDFDKKIIAHRLRPLASDWEKALTLRDYYLKKNSELPKFLTGKKQKPHAYFSPLLDWHTIAKKTSIDLIITEGETRAIALANHDIPCIGLPGVNAVSCIDDLLPDLEKIDWRNRNVSICFDSDIIEKFQVKNALLKLIEALFMRDAKISITLLPNEICGAKNGIDDFIVRHGINAFKHLDDQFKLLNETKYKLYEVKLIEIVNINKTTKKKETHIEYEYSLKRFEPYVTVKSAMVWSILKDRFDYHPVLKWLYWNDKYWEVIDEDKILGTIQKIRYANHWIHNEDEKNLAEFQWHLSEQKTDWSNEKYLGFQNGYLNTANNEFGLPFREARVTSILPFDYDPSAQCPRWLEFLDSTLHLDDTKEYLKAWFRWILAPKPNNANFKLAATLWLVGKSGYGKSTVLDTLKNLVGVNGFGFIDVNKLDNNNSVFNLINKKIAINNDATGYIKDLGKYNSICQNEEVMVWRKQHDEFPMRLGCIPVLAMNSPLGFSGSDSQGLTRRLHILKFSRPPKLIDDNLQAKLKAEIAGIFAWAWSIDLESAIKTILKNKDTGSFEEVFEENITEYQFLYENYLNGGECQAGILLQNYQKWAEAKGFKTTNKNKFSQAMGRLNIEKISTRKGVFYSLPDLEKVSLTELLKGNFEKAQQQALFSEPLTENQTVVTVETRDDHRGDAKPLLDKGGGDRGDGLGKDFSNDFISSSSSFSEEKVEKVVTVITPLSDNGFASSPALSQVTTVITNNSNSQLDDQVIEIDGFQLWEEVMYLPFGEFSMRRGFIAEINKESNSFKVLDAERENIEPCAFHQVEKMPCAVISNIFGEVEGTQSLPYSDKKPKTVAYKDDSVVKPENSQYQECLALYNQIQAKIKEIVQNKGFLEDTFAVVTFENFLTFSENSPLNKKEHLEAYYQWLKVPKNQVVKQTTLDFSEQENSKFSQENLIEAIKSLPTNGKNNSSKLYECPNCQKPKLWLNEQKNLFDCYSCRDPKAIYRKVAQSFINK